jgi:hypothetical protein
MSVITTLYNALESNTDLQTVLANSTINPEKKAIYDHWADNQTPLPYIVIRFDFGTSSHWAKRETSLIIDIFTDGDTVQAEDIRNMVVNILDRNVLEDETDGTKIRCYLNGDRLLDETEGDEISHWNIEFNLHHWRNSFIDLVNE